MMKKLALTCALLVAVQAAYAHPAADDGAAPAPAAEETAGLEKVYKVMQECSEKNMAVCLKMRALQYVDRALRRSDNIDVFDGITLVKSEPVEASRGLNGRSLSESEVEDVKDEDEKDAQVENLLLDRVARFLESHTLQLKVPESSISGMRRSLEEGMFPYFLFARFYSKHFSRICRPAVASARVRFRFRRKRSTTNVGFFYYFRISRLMPSPKRFFDPSEKIARARPSAPAIISLRNCKTTTN